MLFVIAGLITAYGFIKVLKRKREYKDDDDEGNGVDADKDVL